MNPTVEDEINLKYVQVLQLLKEIGEVGLHNKGYAAAHLNSISNTVQREIRNIRENSPITQED